MHISHDFIATKTCPSYKFLVDFGQVRVWDQKSAWRVRVGMVCGAGAGKISQTRAGRERTKNFNPRRTLVCTKSIINWDQCTVCMDQRFFHFFSKILHSWLCTDCRLSTALFDSNNTLHL